MVQDTSYKIQCRFHYLSARLQRRNQTPSSNQQHGSLAATIMISGQLAALISNIFAIIGKLKRQSKRDEFDSIHAHVKTVDFEEITKGNLHEKIISFPMVKS